MPTSTLLARFQVEETIRLPYDPDADPDRWDCFKGQVQHRAVLVDGKVFIERRENDRMGVERWTEVETLSSQASALVVHLAAELAAADARIAGKT